MPLRDTSKYNLEIKGEPKIVTDIRKKIVSTFDELEFVDEGHKYFLHGEELTSVSNISHMFQDEFDADAQAIKYAEKHGNTPEYWKDQWLYKSLKATTQGTLVHSWAESYGWLMNGHPELITDECKCKYIADKNWLVPTRLKEEAVIKFFDELPKDLHLVMNETKVYSSVNPGLPRFKTNYAGTFDALYYYDDPARVNSGLVIYDWKTNADIYSEYSRTTGKMLYYPFNDKYYQEAFSNYTIQLSCYQIPLEDIGLKVIARRLIWLKDDGTYEVVKVDDVTDRIRKVLG